MYKALPYLLGTEITQIKQNLQKRYKRMYKALPYVLATEITQIKQNLQKSYT